MNPVSSLKENFHRLKFHTISTFHRWRVSCRQSRLTEPQQQQPQQEEDQAVVWMFGSVVSWLSFTCTTAGRTPSQPTSPSTTTMTTTSSSTTATTTTSLSTTATTTVSSSTTTATTTAEAIKTLSRYQGRLHHKSISKR